MTYLTDAECVELERKLLEKIDPYDFSRAAERKRDKAMRRAWKWRHTKKDETELAAQ